MRISINTARAVAVALVLFVSVPAFAWKFELGENTNLNIDYLLQVQAQFKEKSAPNKIDWSKDFFVRRSRILLFGDVWKGISFFMETDQVNFGKGGNWDVSFFVQDAFMTFKVVDEFMVDVGMILLPFSRANFQGAIGLNALDYHTGVIKFMDGSTKVWRDAGVQLRGYAFKKKFMYRVGVFNGAQNMNLMKNAKGEAIVDVDKKAALGSNPEDWPRFTGHVRYSIMGTEADTFPKGIYFATSPIISIGAGFDYQSGAAMSQPSVLDKDKKITTAGKVTWAAGATADFFLDIPFGKDFNHEIVFQTAFFWYNHGKELAWDKDGLVSTVVASKNSGFGVMGELGYRFMFFEPVISVDYFGSKQAKQDLLAVRGGLNFWIRKHAANIKLEFGAEKIGDLGVVPWSKTFTTQAQLFF